MARRLPPLNALRAFEAAARHDSFTGAAAELRVSHAAISRHVRALEARIGVTLFRKASRGVELTEAGATFLRSITRAFDDIAAATEALSRARNIQISVSVEPAFATKWLVSRLGGFRDRHPEYDVFLDASPHLVDLERDEADLAVRYGRGEWPGLRLDLLARLKIFPVASPRLIDGRTAPLAPAELARLSLLHDDDGRLWQRWFAAAGSPEIDVTRGARLWGTSLSIEAAVTGQGIALGDVLIVGDDLAAGRLVRLS
ncbi:MAG: LysR substrate-binding domain-containing protein, partial [Dongiaceae bacterium]